MSGFYGNIADTAKTTFSFDIIYENRKKMDEQADNDGVFLGRYVLVDYDNEPIKGYARRDDQGNVLGFYNSTNFVGGTQILSTTNTIYEDISSHTAYDNKFYKYDIDTDTFKILTLRDENPYYARFQDDVSKYGRGYDSTVWVKSYDSETASYKYAMVAELNAVIPTLHLVSQAPNTVPLTPYFDRDTTNIDYYLHMQSDFGTRLKPISEDSKIKSDERASYITAEKVTDATGYVTFNPIVKEGPVDIYYNNDGFQEDTHIYSDQEITYSIDKDDLGEALNNDQKQNITIDYSKNHIGYDMTYSGRLYGQSADMGVYNEGFRAQDIYDWFIRLPGIGNAICKMWDKVYGYREDNKRYVNDALTYEDSTENRVNYDRSTIIGVMNTAQDLIGYHFISLADYTPKAIVTSPDDKITITLKYNNSVEPSEQTVEYDILKCIFYDENKNYFVYHYEPNYGRPVIPEFTDETHTAFKDNKVYYYYKDNNYHIANPLAYQKTDANGNIIENTSEYYLETPQWKIGPINKIADNSIYTLIAQIHTLLGTNIGEVRNMNSIQGAINTMKDVISNIDRNLEQGRLLHTNNNGIIETTGTYFPSADWDKDELLAGDGSWVSRYASVKVRENSENANRKIPKVVKFEATGKTAGSAPVKLADIQQRQEINEKGELVFNEDGTPKMVDIELISDNQRSKDGTTLVYEQAHDPNTLIFATRDKWIRLHPDDRDDSIEFEHTQSPIVNRLSFQALAYPDKITNITGPKDDANSKVDTANFKANADGTEITIIPDSDSSIVYNTTKTDQGDNHHPDMNDNRLTIPYITVDNAGHVVAASTKNYNIPHGFKKVSTTTIGDTNEAVSLDKAGISIAENISDTLNIAPRNRWIDIATETTNNDEGDEEDTITWSHRLAPIEHFKTDVVLNGERRTSENEIPTVYRYGLPANKDISTLDNVNGNEATNTFNIPYIEIDKAGHIVAAETHTVELPENFTTVTLKPQNESTDVEAHTVAADTVLAADTLTDNLTLKTVNRWIGIGLTDNENNDEITFGHRLSDIKDVVPLELNGERRADNKYEKVYRYGLEADKDISTLDENNGVELANTFNVPYMEIDEAGHVVHAETHTVELPDGYTTINIGEPISDDLTDDELADAETMVADTLTEALTINPSNKWIRLKGENTKGIDTITIGHEIHKIDTSLNNTTDLDKTNDKNIITKSINWDQAGHIISEHTETWKLPYSLRNIHVTTTKALDSIENNSEVAKIETAQISDTFNFKPANNWIRLQANGHDISFGHLIQGTAATYTGTDTTFVPPGDTLPRFGDSVTLYGYQTDEAGHVIGYPTYTLTLPKGKYTPLSQGNEGANVITGINFTDSTGEITSTAVNVGTLKLTNYTKLDTTENAVITVDDTINSAFAKLDDRIETEEETRTSDINNLRMFKTINVANTDLVANSNMDTLTITAENDGIILTPISTNNSFTVGHKAGHETTDGFYKLSTDAYGHVSNTTEVTLEDLTALGVATEENLSGHIDITTGNPHNVTAADVGLENVTNESKETMFTDAALTGVPTAPTAEEGTNTTQIATTAFANEAIKEATRLIWEDLKNNYNLVLKQPAVTISQTVSEDKFSAQLVVNAPVAENDTYSYNWSTGDTNNIIEVTENGTYTCIVTRTHNGYTSEAESSIVVTEIIVPEIPEEPIEPQPEEPIV